jgi:hypothetical protein
MATVVGRLIGKRLSIRCLAIAIAVANPATSLASQPGSGSELTALHVSDAVFVSFGLHAENYEDLDLRLSR